MIELSHEAVTADGVPREFVGMHRPPWEKCASPGGYVACTCGAMIQTLEGVREHWQSGHFDRALYKDAA